MSTKTNIEWTDATWNPIRGCSRVSEGCRNCYAERTAARFSYEGAPYEGLAYRENIQRPDGSTLTTKSHWTGTIRFIESKLDEPLHWKKPQRIFVNSMSDLFHERVKGNWQFQIFEIMARCPQHTFQILTKRPRVMLDWLSLPGWSKHPLYELMPLPNVWLGVSVEDQATADERIPLLLQTPAAVRFVSYEPALGPVDFTELPVPNAERPYKFNALDRMDDEHFYNVHPALDWVIAGGESGPGARPAHPEWFRAARNQCMQYGVAFFFKQWGEWLPEDHVGRGHAEMEALQEREYRRVSQSGMMPVVGVPAHGLGTYRVGKKAAGRLVDGIEWNQFPSCAPVESKR